MEAKSYDVYSFRTTYFTLWHVQEELTSYGKVEHYHFVKNISRDEDEVKRLYPGIEFVEGLRGYEYRREVPAYGKVEYVDDGIHFPSGQLKGEEIASCEDDSYMAYMFRYWSNNESQLVNTLAALSARLEERGGILVGVVDWAVGEDADKLRETMAKKAALVEHEAFNVEPFGCGEDGLWFSSEFDCELRWPEVKTSWGMYGPVTMPVLKGKGKRLKGKIVTILDWHWDGKVIAIDSWEIVK